MKSRRISTCLAGVAVVVAVALQMSGCAAQQGTPPSQSAESILNRPNRLAEEQAAWNPKPMSMEEFLNSPVPFMKKYSVTELDKYVVATFWYWMDNRYAITSAGYEKDPATGFKFNIPNIAIMDTETNSVYLHKKGRFFCYKGGNIAYETPEFDKNVRKRFYGEIGSERPVPRAYTSKDGKEKVYAIDEFFDCKNTRGYEEHKEIAREKFGVRSDGFPKLDYVPLLSGHGFFSWGSESNKESASIHKSGAYWAKEIGLDWYGPKGDKKWLELALSYEVDKEVKPNFWSAFLGRYVFNKNALFNRSPLGAHSLLDDFGVQHSLYIVTFSPLDGSVVKVHKPEVVLDKVSTTGIFATRAGFLWTGDIATPGLFLSQGEKLKQVLDELVYPRDVNISPDGCKVKVWAYPNRRTTASGGSFRGALGAVIAHSAPNPSGWDKSRHLLINVCTGE